MTDGASLALDRRTRRRLVEQLYTGTASAASHDATSFPDCATPPSAAKLNTHGLPIRAGKAGHSTLYAVGHGAREAIEVFDVDASGARPALAWRGCVAMPAGLAANSVASLGDGSLVATVLILPGKTFRFDREATDRRRGHCS